MRDAHPASSSRSACELTDVQVQAYQTCECVFGATEESTRLFYEHFVTAANIDGRLGAVLTSSSTESRPGGLLGGSFLRDVCRSRAALAREEDVRAAQIHEPAGAAVALQRIGDPDLFQSRVDAGFGRIVPALGAELPGVLMRVFEGAASCGTTLIRSLKS